MSDMFGIVLCTSCGRKRITDMRTVRSKCPYCGRADITGRMTVLFSDKSQSIVRELFENADSSKYSELEKKKRTDDPDPLSTLVYEYEHTSGTLQKLMVIAKGLTRIKGNFTEKDVDDLFPGKGEQMIKNMISADIIIETGYGNYRGI